MSQGAMIRREDAEPAGLAHDNLPDGFVSELNPHRRDDKSESYEFFSAVHETAAMVNSPDGSLREHVYAEVSPRGRRRGVTYASPAASENSDQNTLQQDSAYYSTHGGIDGDRSSDADSDINIKEQQLRAREQVLLLRRKVLKTRQLKRRNRDSLRQLREHKRAILDKLTEKINELVALNRIAEDIVPYCDEHRAAQDELGPAEDDYERLEIRLDNEEEDLEEEEGHYYELFRYNSVFEVPNQGSKFDPTISPVGVAKPYDDQSNWEVPDFDLETDLLQDYLSTIDEALATRKELQNLEDDYVRVSEDAKIRRRNRFPLFATMATFLSEYPKSRAEILENLYRAEDELLGLREECLEQGVFAKTEYMYEPRDALRDDLMEAVEIALERSPLRVAAQHIKHGEAEVEVSKKDYVNDWLLQRAQDSTVDMMMLRAWIYSKRPGIAQTPNKTLVEMGDDRWTVCSIANWFTDGAGKFAEVNYQASRLDAIAGATNKLNVDRISWSLSPDSSLNIGSTNWSLSTNSSGNVGLDLDYDLSASTVVLGSEAASHDTEKGGDLDTTPTKPKAEKGKVTPTIFALDAASIQLEQDSITASISPTSGCHSTEPASVEFHLPPIISYRPEFPSCGILESKHHLVPNPQISILSTSYVPSLRNARTSLDKNKRPTSEPPLYPATSPGRASRPLFLETPQSPLPRSLSLTSLERPTHQLARRSFELLRPLGTGTCFIND